MLSTRRCRILTPLGATCYTQRVFAIPRSVSVPTFADVFSPRGSRRVPPPGGSGDRGPRPDRWGVALLIVLATAGPVRAEPVTLEDAYRSALAVNERVQRAEEGVFQARDEVRRARSFVLPSVKLEASYTRSPLEEVDRGGGVSILQARSSTRGQVILEQSVYSGGRLRAGLRAAARGVDVSRTESGLAKEDLLFDVARAFYDVLKAKAGVTVLERDVERLTEHRRQADARVRVGEATRPVLLRAEAELAGAQANLIRARSDIEIAKDRLDVLTDLGADLDPVEPEAPVVPEIADEAPDVAIEQRRDVARSAFQEAVADEQIALARSRFFPSVTLEGRYTSQDQSPQTSFAIDSTWSAGARLDFTLFEGLLRVAEWRQAQSRARQARLERERLRKEARLEIRQAQVNLRVLTAERETLEKQVAFARENYELVSKQFAFGLATNIDALDAAQTLGDAEQRLVAATYDRHLAILALQKSAGVFEIHR